MHIQSHKYLNHPNCQMVILSISIITHNGNPSGQVEKTERPPEVFEIGNTTFYLVENIDNYAVIWLTEHYECFILSSLNVDKNILKDMIYSMIE